MRKVLFSLLILSLLVISGCRLANLDSSISKSKAISIAQEKIRLDLKGWTDAGINIDINTISTKKENKFWTIDLSVVVMEKLDPKTNAKTTLKYLIKVNETSGKIEEPVNPYFKDTATV
jgi:hypothetical protein